MLNSIQAGIRRDAGDASAQGWNAPAGAESAEDGAISSDATRVASSTVECSGCVFEEKRGGVRPVHLLRGVSHRDVVGHQLRP